MPELVVSNLVKVVLLMLLLGGMIVLLVSFISPTTFNLGGAINTAFYNLIASILG